MIPQVLLKLLLPKVLDHLMQVFKLDKMLDYMELPNDADRKIVELQDEVERLKNIAHAPVIALDRIEAIEDKLELIKIVEMQEDMVDVIDDSQAGNA
tara:strand:+ start:421 stop:711 length:291 start_codon:yes stop_codon:yes gene_type:complete